jgi:hypothetical protein
MGTLWKERRGVLYSRVWLGLADEVMRNELSSLVV